MTLTMLWVAIFAPVLLPAGSTRAEDDAGDDGLHGGLTEELLIGESPFAQEAGEFQVTFGASYHDGDEAETTGLFLEVEYGITDRLQIGFELPYTSLSPTEAGESAEDGFGDLELGVLYTVLQDDAWTASLAVELALDTGDEDRDLGEGALSGELTLLVAYTAESWELYFGIGGEWVEGGESGVVYSAGLGVPLEEALGLEGLVLLVELAGESGIEGEDELSLAPSLSVELEDNWEMIVGAPIGLTDDTDDWGVIAKLSVEF